VVRSALQILRFLIEAIPAADVTSVILSPYFKKASVAAEKRRRLDRKLRDDRRWELSASQLVDSAAYAEAMDMSFKDALPKAIKTLDVKPQTFSAWSDRFGRVLQKQLLWPGDALESMEYQAVQVWEQIIDELESLDDGTTVPVTTALDELQRLCKQRLFQPETPRAPIQIMGRLESHGLTFDHLWISGCDASQWPAKVNPTSLLPRSLQQTRGVPESSASHRLEAAIREWTHWCQSAPSVIASHALTRDGQALLPAAPVSTLSVADDKEFPGYSDHQDLVDLIAASSNIESIDDSYGPALADDASVKGGARRLEDQAKCPFRGFAIHHLGIRNLEDPGMGLDPRAHGNLLHVALEKFWEAVKTSSALLAMDETARDAMVEQVISESLADNAVDQSLEGLERRRLHRLISDWLTLEATRPVGFTVEAVEAEHLVKDFGFEIKVIVDRVDVLETGERVILDYKTGRNNRPKDWALERIGNPQLPLYATIDENVEGVSFAQVAQNEMAFKGITSSPGQLPRVGVGVHGNTELRDWDAWREHWKQSLETLASEIKSGLATITPDAKACQFCDLKPLCRYRVLDEDAVDLGVNHDD